MKRSNLMRMWGLAIGACALVAGAAPAAADEPVVFTNVNVIPMDEERVLEDQTVVIAHGVIAAMGDADAVETPEGARVVDGTGRYLMPGLAEMHAHVPGGGQYQRDVMFLYLANGVTLARGMAGHPSQVELRRDVATGDVPGPRLIVGGTWLGGGFSSPEVAAQEVRRQAEMGYDFLKMGGGPQPAIFEAIVEQARKSNIGIAGHVPGGAVGVPEALDAGFLSIDHFDSYMQAMVDPDEVSGISPGFFGYRLAPHVEQERMEQIARETREAGVWNVPTETIIHSRFALDLDEVREQRTEFQYMPQNVIEGWFNNVRDFRAASDFDAEAGEQFIQVRLDLIKALHDEGAGLLLGSDAPQWFNVPGFSVHYEILVMGDAGLTPFEVLQTGTVNPAIYLGEEEVFGQVQDGFVADLVLLNANPLDDLANTNQIEGVMRAGRYFDRETLDAELAAIAERYAQ